MVVSDQTNSGLIRAILIPVLILAWIGVVIGLVWVLAHVAHTLLVIVLATVIAVAISSLVRILALRLPRGLAIAVAYAITVIVVANLLGFVIVSLASEAGSLASELAKLDTSHAETLVVRWLRPFGIKAVQVDAIRSELVTRLQQWGADAASHLFADVQGLGSILIDAVLVLILSMYLVAGQGGIGPWLEQYTPSTQQRHVRLGTAIVNQVLGGYVRGTITMALFIGVLVTAGMAVFRVHYALLLGVVAFFMAFVPVVGTFISGSLCVVVALFQGWPLAVVVLIYFAGVHILEGYVVGPRVVGKALGIHPAVALIALLAGTELFGFWGTLFGAPLAGLLQATAVALWGEYRSGSLTANKTTPATASMPSPQG